jgi:hypothetical protein
MINIDKTYPAPTCLEREKQKANGDYKCGNVLELLKKDFYNKCYICEYKAPLSINVEHFKPHRGDKDQKFDWKNLFFVCAHCNNIKLDRYNTCADNQIFNCTNPQHDIQNWIKYEMVHFPKKTVKITALRNEKIVVNTVKLLNEVYNGTTKEKIMEADNLKERLQEELIDFQDIIINYLETHNNEEKEIYMKQIQKLMDKSSAFTAFKQQIGRQHAHLG